MDPIYCLIYIAHPRPSHPEYGIADGAFAVCWVKESIHAAADAAARARLTAMGWDIEKAYSDFLHTDESCPPGSEGRPYFEYARREGLDVVLVKWPIGGRDDA